jgi:ABC-type transporter Mla maintaining outer membrane lipid asymmetry ATPase subunit MlaF
MISGDARAVDGFAIRLQTRTPDFLIDVALDAGNELIALLGRQLRVTSIVVTHDLDTAFDVGDRIALLYEGRIRACDTPDRILEHTDPIVPRVVGRRGPGPARG